MTINAIPDLVDPQDINLPKNYICPLCEAQSVADKDSTGWVLCPMLENQAICLGCCLDHQAVARSFDFDGHPYRDLFDNVSQLSGKPVVTLRQICLQHQSDILYGNLGLT